MTLWEDAQANLVQLRRAIRREPQTGMHLPAEPTPGWRGRRRAEVSSVWRRSLDPNL